MKLLKVFLITIIVISLMMAMLIAGMFSTSHFTFGQATSAEVICGIFAYIAYGALREIRKSERIPDAVNYTSSFHLGEPVVTTEEYYDGAGYHAYIESIDKTDEGRPFKIRMCGNDGFDWVSIDEIIPDREVLESDVSHVS